MILILDNVRSAYNVGALFRSADGVGVRHVYLVGITPHPAKSSQQFLTRAEKTLHKTALGAEYAVPWTYVRSLSRLITRLRQSGHEIIALEEGINTVSRDYRTWQPKSDREPVLILGGEVTGLSAHTLTVADLTLHLPMRGTKHSLNASVAGSIALYHLSATIEKLSKPSV